jgi:uncharacterized protein YuzE
MRLIYDTQADALDISLEEGIVARTEEIDNGTLVDVDASGRLLSIEVIGPARNWPLEEIADRFNMAEMEVELLRAIRGTPVKFRLEETGPLALA